MAQETITSVVLMDIENYIHVQSCYGGVNRGYNTRSAEL